MKVELTGPHTHGGKALDAGAIIEVDEATAQWLIEHAGAKSAGSPRKSKTEGGATATDNPPTEVQE